MAIRIQEIHPSVVHFPIALIPTAVAVDALGHATGNQALMDMGRRLMPVAAASAAIAGTFGLLAQGAVRAEGRAHSLLTTHRTLNAGLFALTTAMAVMRSRREQPSPGYLLAGLAGTAALSYSAYLGGKMVYERGVGVAAAGGVRRGAAPEIRRGRLALAARKATEDITRGARMSVEDMAKGEIVPELVR
jgi:uncharacterized membrane protein